MKERIDYYDRAKGLLILLVVIRHIMIYATPEYNIIPYILASSFINSFHMPAFFVISGMLLDNEQWRTRNWREFVARRIKTLIVPYIFFELCGCLYRSCVLQQYRIVDGIYRMITLRYNVGADWFLIAMFVAQATYFCYIKHPNKIIWGIIASLSFFSYEVLLVGDGWEWRTLCNAIWGFGFIFLGNTFKKFLLYIPGQKSKFYMAIGGAFCLTAVCAALCFKFGGDYIEKNPLLLMVCGISGAYFVLAISQMVHFKCLSWVGKNSLVIMGTHQLVLYTVPSSSSILWVAGVFVLILVIELPVIFLTGRFCPFLVGKAKLAK